MAKLRVMRRWATGLLVFAAFLFLVTHLYESTHPWIGFVRAAAEASLVGGLADWFAVTAIFRHPLGIPIPHTAIVPSQKDRIGRTLGNFLKNHFLTRDIIAAEVRRLGLSERAAHWLRDPENSRKLAGQLAGGLARAIQALPEKEVRALIQRNALERVQKTSVAPIMANLLSVVTTENRHYELLDEVLDMISRAVTEHRDAIKGRLKKESPWWIPSPVDQAISKQLLAALEGSVSDVRDNPFHPIRRRFDQAVAQFIERLRTSPEVAARADALKDQFLNSAVIEEFVAGLWESIKSSAARYADDPEHHQPDTLATGITSAGDSLLANADLRAELDAFLTDQIANAAEKHRDQIADLVARTVAAWDPEVAARRLELAVGSDLQFIRINGTLVGGLVGLLLHALKTLL
ncbi:MAG TPA: DUF445 domain-containing protein [Gemmatimonadales bacterium]|nr:DUF445 domain-containing protein [Gemmatimonadales bacterium]